MVDRVASALRLDELESVELLRLALPQFAHAIRVIESDRHRLLKAAGIPADSASSNSPAQRTVNP
jgi:hypothetical protein